MRRRRISARGFVFCLLLAAPLVAGCRAAQRVQARISGELQRGDVSVGGRTRTYYVHIPAGKPGPLPVVLAFHGGGGNAQGMAQLIHLDSIADRDGFLAVYPEGYQHSWADGRGTTAADRAGINDVGFVAALLDRLATRYSIDRQRVYATGISNGALFSERLGCQLADRIAGIAPVAGTLAAPLGPTCKPARPVSVLLIHGTRDPLVPYQGGHVEHGRGGGGEVLSAQDTLAEWARLDACAGAPASERLSDAVLDGTHVATQTYASCSAGTAVSLSTIEGGGHTWPGGMQYLPKAIVGPTSRQFDAGELMWQFFAAHTRANTGSATADSTIERRLTATKWNEGSGAADA